MSVKNKEKKKRPFPQFKMLRDIPIEELSDHLNVAINEGYTAWNTYPVPATETRRERNVPRGPGRDFEKVTEIKEGPLRIHLLVWYDANDDDEDDE